MRMKTLNEKLNLLKKKVDEGDRISIAIFGLGYGVDFGGEDTIV